MIVNLYNLGKLEEVDGSYLTLKTKGVQGVGNSTVNLQHFTTL